MLRPRNLHAVELSSTRKVPLQNATGISHPLAGHFLFFYSIIYSIMPNVSYDPDIVQRYASFEGAVRQSMGRVNERKYRDHIIVDFIESGGSFIAMPFSGAEATLTAHNATHPLMMLAVAEQTGNYDSVVNETLLFGFGGPEVAGDVETYMIDLCNLHGVAPNMESVYGIRGGEAVVISSLREMIRNLDGLIQISIDDYQGINRLRMDPETSGGPS